MNISRFHISDNIFVILSDCKRDGRCFERPWWLLHRVPQLKPENNWKNSIGFRKISKFIWWEKRNLPDYLLKNFFIYQFFNNFSSLLLFKINFLDAFETGDIFKIFGWKRTFTPSHTVINIVKYLCHGNQVLYTETLKNTWIKLQFVEQTFK